MNKQSMISSSSSSSSSSRSMQVILFAALALTLTFSFTPSFSSSFSCKSQPKLVSAETVLKETFSDPAEFEKNWVKSQWKSEEEMGQWDLSPGDWYGDKDINTGLRTTQDARFYAIARNLPKTFSNRDKDLVVQFSVKHEKKGSSFCAGGYIKLLPEGTDLATFGGETPYLIMFGPDLCGSDVSRVHTIFNFKGENLLKKKDIKLDYNEKNEYTHVYTLVVHPDNTYEVLLDLETKAEGSLLEDWDFPPKQIDDPSDKKPDDWVDEPKIPDPNEVKPEGYDDIPKMIPDPNAQKPEDWDDEDDGEWEPPMINNPEYKGPWKPTMIDNPDYKGPWEPKKIDNPDYVPDVYAYDKIGAVGFELWVVNSGSIFDNIYVGDSLSEAKQFAEETYKATIDAEKEAKKALDEANAEEEGGGDDDEGVEEDDEDASAEDLYAEDEEGIQEEL